MPVSICGPLQIHNVTTNGLVKFGDGLLLTPKTQSEAYEGSGGSNTGVAVIINSGVSVTNYIDPNIIDQPIAGNN